MDKCQKMVIPIGKNKQPYQCRRLHYKDGWCKQHYPEPVGNNPAARKKYQMEQMEERARKNKLTIENAIVLLVRNGYRVELMVNAESYVTLKPCLPQG